MKHTKLIAMALFLLGASGAVGQSLGDAARAARKNKPESTSATRITIMTTFQPTTD